MISKSQQQKTTKTSKKIPKCPDIDAEYGSCIMYCNDPCIWGLRRWSEYKRTGK